MAEVYEVGVGHKCGEVTLPHVQSQTGLMAFGQNSGSEDEGQEVHRMIQGRQGHDALHYGISKQER